MAGSLIALAVVGLIVLVALVLIFWAIGIYNRLVTLRQGVDASWAQIDVQLKRRYDLIPNLVETVKGYATHEKGTFEAVTNARAACLGAQKLGPGGAGQLAQAEGMLTSALKTLFAVAEAYPQLKANENFLQLQGQLGETENLVAGRRGGYNETVREYNTQTQLFPASIVAGMFGFTQRSYFEVENPEERIAPKVKF